MSAFADKQQEFTFSPREEVDFLRSSAKRYEERIEQLQDINQRLEEKVAMLEFQLYGRKSERCVQIEADLEEEILCAPVPAPRQPDAPKAPSTDGARKHTRKLRARITKEVIHTIIPEEVKSNPLAYERMSENMDKVSRRLEYVPGHTELHITRRPCYVLKAHKGEKTREAAPICAPAPASILPGSNIGASIIAYVMHARFVLHVPFYRTIRELERMGLYGVDEVILCNWHRAVAEALEPIWKAMHELMLSSEVLHVDETPFRCLKSDRKQGYMWALSCAETGTSLYYWQDSRSGHVLDNLLREGMQSKGLAYGGTILTDGYDGYKSWRESLVEKGETAPLWQNCWAHVRRKFVECITCGNDPEWSRRIVGMITPLYLLERKLREAKATPEEVQLRRWEESLPRVEQLFTELTKKVRDSSNPPLNKLKDAIDYALVRKDMLCNWLSNPTVPLDNNRVERAIRPLTIGRKNSLFIGAPEAGQRTAILYTMVEECKRLHIDPQAWLTEVLRRLPTYRTTHAYLDLLPGILPLHSQDESSRVVKL